MSKAKRKFEHIYFESKKPGRDSVTRAVKDIGQKGCKSPREVGAVAVAQLIDYLDGKTYNKQGKVIKFTKKLWTLRTRILRILGRKYGGLRIVNKVDKLRKLYDEGKISRKELIKELKKLVKKHKIPITKYRI